MELSCGIASPPNYPIEEYYMTWMKGDAVVQSRRHYNISSSSTQIVDGSYLIENVASSDAGVYKCEGKVSVSKSSATISLSVIGK